MSFIPTGSLEIVLICAAVQHKVLTGMQTPSPHGISFLTHTLIHRLPTAVSTHLTRDRSQIEKGLAGNGAPGNQASWSARLLPSVSQECVSVCVTEYHKLPSSPRPKSSIWVAPPLVRLSCHYSTYLLQQSRADAAQLPVRAKKTMMVSWCFSERDMFVARCENLSRFDTDSQN